jgi:N-acetylneuraminate synthase/N,N'-diacetyllegionaminate synthase
MDQILNDDQSCFVIAEIGLNHNGDYQLAYDSVVEAAKCGVSAVKFQNFLTEDFLTDKTILHTYKKGEEEVTEPLFDICKRSEFKREWIKPLKALCDEKNIVFLSTPTSQQGVDDLIDNGVDMLKNGSDYLTHSPLLKYMAGKGIVLILSIGMAFEEDIDDAVKVVQDAMHPDTQLVLLHCTSSYPTTIENVNLRKMLTLKERYNVTVGFSDHTQGWVSAVQAVTLGARVIEKHFTLDKCLPGPDHWFSSDPKEMKELVSQIRLAEKRLGSAKLRPAESEMAVRDQWRLGLVWDRDLRIGELVTENDIAIRKPANGLLPKDLDQIIGKVVTQNCMRGRSVIRGDFTK